MAKREAVHGCTPPSCCLDTGSLGGGGGGAASPDPHTRWLSPDLAPESRGFWGSLVRTGPRRMQAALGPGLEGVG